MNQRTLSNLRKAVAIGVVAFVIAALAADVFARVGGGGVDVEVLAGGAHGEVHVVERRQVAVGRFIAEASAPFSGG